MIKLAILGGGNMGGSIADSLVGVPEFDITVTAHSPQTVSSLQERLPDFRIITNNREAVTDADIVVFAVKPYILKEVADEIQYRLKPGATIISVVAGVSIADLEAMLGEGYHIFRVIPNTAISLRKSATFIAGKPGDDPEKVIRIFSRSGKTFPVPEKDMAAVTALSSSGIAYFLRFIRAATEGAIELGLRPRFAAEVAAATAEGAAALVAAGGHPEAEIDKVTTPGGITIKGLNALEANGFTGSVVAALKASYK